MKKYLILILSVISLTVFSQTESGDTPISRVYVGANFGLQFGNFTMIDISPLAGYNLTNWLSAGIGGTYMFINFRSQSQNYNTNFYGIRGFARGLIGQQFFLHSEYELLNGEKLLPNQSGFLNLQRTWQPSFWVGGGYRTPAGNNSFFTFTLLYNLLDTPDSFYGNPITARVGYIFGLFRN
jgi:hypothetical protein